MASKLYLVLLLLTSAYVHAFTAPGGSILLRSWGLQPNQSLGDDKARILSSQNLLLHSSIKGGGASSSSSRLNVSLKTLTAAGIEQPKAAITVAKDSTLFVAQSSLKAGRASEKIGSHISGIYSKIYFSGGAAWQSLMPRSIHALRQKLGTSKVRTILFGTVLCASIYLSIDTFLTKRRQSLDATSEWGRYADHPSIRGRALFGLMGRISLLLLWARVVNTIIPGGKHFALKGRKNSNNADELNSSWAAKKAAQIRTRTGAAFADGLLRLGPLYIKIGQILSCRDNLLPDEWKESMERLQDQVPAKSGEEALQLAYSAYDGGKKEFDSLFLHFNDVPLAAASLGQVHTATLRSNNATIAIKLQRPRLRDIYDKDLALMNKIAKAVDKFGGKAGAVGGVKQSWEVIFQDAEEILYREIDYRAEGENALKFSSDFGLGIDGEAVTSSTKSLDGKPLPSAASWLRTPFVYSDVSNERALVMEFVPSIKITDNEKLARAGVTEEEKEYLAECLGRAYLRQFCCNKFFSTDPHAGNLGVVVNRGSGNKKSSVQLVFYDFGQACSLKEEQAGGILDVIEGIISYDVDKCVNAFQRMGVLADNADLDKVKRKVNDNFQTGKIMVKERKKKEKIWAFK